MNKTQMSEKYFSITELGLILQIQVLPNAPKSEIIGIHDDRIKIKIKSPPVDGKANQEVIRFFSELFEVSKSKVQILKGDKSKLKSVLILLKSNDKMNPKTIHPLQDQLQIIMNSLNSDKKSIIKKSLLIIFFLGSLGVVFNKPAYAKTDSGNTKKEILSFVKQLETKSKSKANSAPLNSNLSEKINLETKNMESEINPFSGQVYIDPDVKIETVFSEPGKTWQDCKNITTQEERDKLCIAWPDINSFISTLGKKEQNTEKIISMQNPSNGETEDVKFIKVHVEYERPTINKTTGKSELVYKQVDGWIEADRLRTKLYEPVYSTAANSLESKKPFPQLNNNKNACEKASCRKDQLQELSSVAKQIADKSKSENQLNLDKLTNSILPMVGKCPLDGIPPKKRLSQWKDKNIYDQEVTPLINKIPASAIKQSVKSKDHLVSIDVLARTIFSEMHGCFKAGIQYPMAVAKVVLNRKKLLDSKNTPEHFVHGQHPSNSTDIQKLVTAKAQFSVWNYSGAQNPKDKTILMSLCPTTVLNSTQNWKGSEPSSEDVDIWKKSVKIATEAVLFPDEFQNKTKNVKQLYYTSGMSSYNGKKLATDAQILGRPINKQSCMSLWN